MSKIHKAIHGGGYVADSAFVEDSAFVAPTATVGERSYVGHGAYISAGVAVGDDCIICDRVRVIVSVPNGTTLTCDCCGDTPAGDSMLHFDSVNVVGGKLAAYVTTGKVEGTIAYVGNELFTDQNSVHDYYRLVYGEGLLVPTYGLSVVNSPTFGVDGAQWLRMNVIDEQATQKTFWSVDPLNVSGVAHDENTGWGNTQAAADLHPLVSLQALNARLRGYRNDGLHIHIMSAPTAATFTVLESLSSIVGSDDYVYILGNKTAVNAAGTNKTVTARQVAVPATNTERTITVPGLTAGTVTGMMVQTTNGQKTAFITRELGSNVYAISEPRSSDAAGTVGAVVDFAVNDQITVFNLTQLIRWPFPDSGCIFPFLALFRLDASGSGGSSYGNMGSGEPTIGQCILGDPAKPGVLSFNLFYTGDLATVYSSQMSGQHANVIAGGAWSLWSVAISVGGSDGPQVRASNWDINGELNIVGTNGAPAFRQLPGGPFNLFIAGDIPGNQIACFGPINVAFDLWQPQHAPSGSLVVRTDSNGPTKFKWYGNPGASGTAGLRLLTLGAGSQSQLPFSALLTVATGGQKPILIDGVGFDFADVPISLPTGAVLAGASDGAVVGMPLNVGKQYIGGGHNVSYGDQSPALDAVPLAWIAGDRRYYVGSNDLIIEYICTASGTPGTWREVRNGNTFRLALSYGDQSGDGALPIPPEASPTFFLHADTNKTVQQSTFGSPGSIWEYEVGPGIDVPAGRIVLDLFVYSCALSGIAATSLTMAVTRNGVVTSISTPNLDGVTNTRIVLAPSGAPIVTGDRVGVLVTTSGLGTGFLMCTATVIIE